MAFVLGSKGTRQQVLKAARNLEILASGVRVDKLPSAQVVGKKTYGIWVFVKKTAKRRKRK